MDSGSISPAGFAVEAVVDGGGGVLSRFFCRRYIWTAGESVRPVPVLVAGGVSALAVAGGGASCASSSLSEGTGLGSPNFFHMNGPPVAFILIRTMVVLSLPVGEWWVGEERS